MSTVANSASASDAIPVMNIVRALVSILGLALFCGVLFLDGLGERDLLSSHEARAAQNAQMILDEGHWLVPRLFDQHLELQKPPLYYWLVAGIAWLRGGIVDVWAVRLPAALAALATVFFVYLLAALRGRPRTGLLAAFILASCLHFTWLAQVGRIDMPLTLVITIALGSFHLGQHAGPDAGGSRRQRFLWHALGYTALGAGLLLKGPIAVVLPALVAGASWLWRDRLHWQRHVQHVRTSSLLWGVPWMILLAGPWFIWANERTQHQLWDVFFWYHNVERGLGGAETLRSHPWWFYLLRMSIDLLPWSLAIPWAIHGLWRQRARQTPPEEGLGLLWFSAMVLFLSCMRFKRADYLLPAYPGMALFLGAWAERWWQKRRLEDSAPLAARWAPGIFVGLLLSYAGGWLIYHHVYAAQEHAWSYRTLAREIRRHTQGPIIFFRAESHVLAHHVGQPVGTILEWENLQVWAEQPFPVYIVMPAKCVQEIPLHLSTGALREVLQASDYVPGMQRPLVVLCNRCQAAADP